MEAKARAARAAVQEVVSGQVLGLGTGSTTALALEFLAARIREEGLDVVGVPTSVDTERRCHELGIPLTTLETHPALDLALDGADQVDAHLHAIKGYGGALLREKIVARAARRFVVMVHDAKLAEHLDRPVPVEVLPFALGLTRRALEAMGRPVLRMRDGEPVVSDNGNVFLDVDFGVIRDPAALAPRIAALPGVIDHGLFVGLAHAVYVGGAEGVRVLNAPGR